MEWKGGRYESQGQWCTVSHPDVRSSQDTTLPQLPPWFDAAGSRRGEKRPGPKGSAPWWSSLGAGLHVCARWCPTLPHPGGCSTIGAVRLSFRVRDGLPGVIPVAVTTETIVRAVLCCCLVLYVVVGLAAFRNHHARMMCVVDGRVGCGPYSGRFTLLLLHHPPNCVGGVVVCVGLLVPVSSQTVTGLPLLAYQPSSLLGAYQEHRGVLVETLS